TMRGTRRHSAVESLDDVSSGLEARLSAFADATGVDAAFTMHPIAEAYRVDEGAAVVSALDRAYQRVRGEVMDRDLSPAVTNAAHFATVAKIPVVGYGPDISTAHSDHEVVQLDELVELVPLFVVTAVEYFASAEGRSGLTPDRLQDMLGEQFV
ncbi:MAG: M20/M25/M40 family metallo-hydrolase, partial [Microbacterium sp.]